MLTALLTYLSNRSLTHQMKRETAITLVQNALQIPLSMQAPSVGPLTKGCLARLAATPPGGDYLGPTAPDVSAVSKDLGQPGEVNARDISDRGAKFIQAFEGLFLKAYDDGGGVLTIGWGHTGLTHEDGAVYAGRVITEAKAWQLFRYDMEQFEARVSALVHVPLTDDQYAALVSFDFNTGGLRMDRKDSTLLTKLNAGDTVGALVEFTKWTHDNGKEVAGLVRRRYSEIRLFVGMPDPLLPDMAATDKFAKVFGPQWAFDNIHAV